MANVGGVLRHPWLLDYVCCPLDQAALTVVGEQLRCGSGHVYPIVRGIPILADSDSNESTIRRSFADAESGVSELATSREPIDPFVRRYLVATNGNLYRGVGARMTGYPIPTIRVPDGRGSPFIDIGCGWGRWSIAASRKGYRPIGIDASLDCVMAAERVASQLNVEAAFIVGSLRSLPLQTGSIMGVVYSYSVLQHFDHHVARTALSEMRRVSADDSTVLVQFANRLGVRQLLNQARAVLRRREGEFDMRYWTRAELEECGRSIIGPTEIEVDGFFSVNAQATDVQIVSLPARLVIRASMAMTRMCGRTKVGATIADSLFMRSRVQLPGNLGT